MNLEIGTEGAQFPFPGIFFPIFGTVSLQCTVTMTAITQWFINNYMRTYSSWSVRKDTLHQIGALVRHEHWKRWPKYIWGRRVPRYDQLPCFIPGTRGDLFQFFKYDGRRCGEPTRKCVLLYYLYSFSQAASLNDYFIIIFLALATSWTNIETFTRRRRSRKLHCNPATREVANSC